MCFPRAAMHTIADAQRLIPAAQKLPVLLSRDHNGVPESIKKPLECATSLANKKGCAVAHTLFESQSNQV